MKKLYWPKIFRFANKVIKLQIIETAKTLIKIGKYKKIIKLYIIDLLK